MWSQARVHGDLNLGGQGATDLRRPGQGHGRCHPGDGSQRRRAPRTAQQGERAYGGGGGAANKAAAPELQGAQRRGGGRGPAPRRALLVALGSGGRTCGGRAAGVYPLGGQPDRGAGRRGQHVLRGQERHRQSLHDRRRGRGGPPTHRAAPVCLLRPLAAPNPPPPAAPHRVACHLGPPHRHNRWSSRRGWAQANTLASARS